jgi:CheY-specific phosphatase CheX
MQTDNKDVVSEVFCGVIEQIAFLFAKVAEPATLPAMNQPFVQAAMSFDGPLRGRLIMAVPRQACSQIAANVLGMEVDDERVASRADDSLREILNVTCGHILTSLAGDRLVFDLSIPQVSDLDDSSLEALLASPGTAGFLVEESPVLVRLEMQEA